MSKSVLSLISLALLTSSAWGVENGTPVDWAAQDNAVRLDNTSNAGVYCTATLVAGRYALTAAHCLDEGLDTVVTASSHTIPFTQFDKHPNYVFTGGFSSEDVGIVTLDNAVDYSAIQFFNIDDRVEGESISIAGFGGTIETLNAVDLTFSHYSPNDNYRFVLYADVVVEASHTTKGDSGSAWVNHANEIMAIHKGSNPYGGARETYGTDIQAVQDFLTENIDAWHYPTLAKVNGRTTITVQSLHLSGITDTAYTDGNITLISGDSTCVTEGLIAPFEQCTYVIEGNSGEEGHLYLSDSQVIHINKPEQNNAPDSGSGASLGFLSLFGLALFGRLRRKEGEI
ncbi:trypsin-like serine protease [uncultured Vibrio sp.]|uniref:trypsin-like serine protease n=1 Tax=uncultured Vibrio sp. TaxID=114054 RepID=UPI00260A80DA|nr:trypsin-like serine protease [uncultured Vibrio sp.]